jgi:hypothetical protein
MHSVNLRGIQLSAVVADIDCVHITTHSSGNIELMRAAFIDVRTKNTIQPASKSKASVKDGKATV